MCVSLVYNYVILTFYCGFNKRKTLVKSTPNDTYITDTYVTKPPGRFLEKSGGLTKV